MNKKIRFLLLLLSILVCLIDAGQVLAKPPDLSDSEELRRRARQEEQERQNREQAKDERRQPAKSAHDGESLPEEALAFPIHTLQLEGDTRRFHWLQQRLNRYAGRRIGRDGINLIVKRLSAELVDRGYITTRIGIPEQDLSRGVLRLVLIPGVIQDIRFSGETRGDWQSAFPCRPGDILNLRDLEQGLEQMKRLPSQEADFQIVPGDKAGESNILISLKRAKPWRVAWSLDNSGSENTGKLQAGLQLSYDNPLGRNDLFIFNLNHDADGEPGSKGTSGSGFAYILPRGNWTFTFSASQYRYHQNISGYFQDFQSSGDSQSLELTAQRLLRRDQNSKTSLQLKLTRRTIHSYIDDIEIEVQRKNVTNLEAALQHRQYRGKTIIDAQLACRVGVPWFGAQKDLEYFPETNRFAIWTGDLSVRKPLTIGKIPAQYTLQLKAQLTRNRLFATEYFSIGNRYTVRGFDGEQTLASENGWYIRNELAIPRGNSGTEIYLGCDWGRVWGPSDYYLAGKELAGAVIGLRGTVKKLTFDLFAAWPIRKPEGFQTGKLSVGFSLTQQI